jgi:ribosome recycling factor
LTSNDELKRLSEKIDNLTEEEISNLKEIYKKEERKSNIKSTEFSFIPPTNP